MKNYIVKLVLGVFATLIFSTIGLAQCTFLDGVVFNPSNYNLNYGAINVEIFSGTTPLTTVASSPNGYWQYYDCSNNTNYRIKFGSLEFKWSSDRDGNYDVRDFGATGDGSDQKLAIQNAIYYVASKSGGKLLFPRGYYKTSDGFVLPPRIIIEGTGGESVSACRLELMTQNKYLFKIGEKTNGISIKDILLTTTYNPQPAYLSGTTGILAQGAVSASPNNSNSSIGFVMRDSTLIGFENAIKVEGLDSGKLWQFDNAKLDHVTLSQCKNCINLDTINTDWQISNSWIGVLKDGFGLNITKAGFILIENTIGAGPSGSIGSLDVANTFINIQGKHGTIKIDNSQCEQFRQSIVVNYDVYGVPEYPIMVANSIFGDPILFKKNAIFVSTANTFLSDTVRAEVAGETPKFPDGTPYTLRKRRVNCEVPDQSCCTEEFAPIPPLNENASANNVKFYSTGDNFLNYNRYWCTNSFANGITYPTNFLLSGSSSIFGGRTNNSNIGIGTNTPGLGLSGTPSVLEIETKNGQLPWMILKRTDSNGSSRRWGWTVAGDGSLYLQDIGYGNRLQVDTNGNFVPVTDNTGQIGTDTKRWAKVRAAVVMSGDLVLSDIKTGEKLYTIKEDKENILFMDYRTGNQLMRLDRSGNLFLKGKIFQSEMPKRAVSLKRKRSR
jgi:hypothetical protein